jgi:S1-C subfamily serine protease
MVGLVESAKSVREISVIAKVALRDPTSDLLFLEIKDSAELTNIRPLQRSSLASTEQITAVGFYQDSPELTFSHGSSKSQAPSQHETLTTIIVSKGFSGAPVVNSKGELIGVVSSYHPLAANKDIGIARYVDIK